MPRRFTFRRRRYRKKFGNRKRVKRTLRKMHRIGLNYVKLRTTALLTTDAAGLYSNTFGYTNLSGLEDWANFVTLYDQYRCFALKIKFIPELPNSVPTLGFKPFYAVRDYDDVTALSTIPQAIQYENCMVKNLYRPWSIYSKVPKVTNLATNSTIVNFGWMDVATPQITGGLKMITDGLDASTTYGTFIVTAYVAFKGRR